MVYEVYTDGACSKNPGPGGYSFVVVLNKSVILKCYGHKDRTTNNCMELTAIVRALKHVASLGFVKFYKDQVQSDDRIKIINIYSDSAYCVNAMNQGWVKVWQANGWKTKSGYDVKNKELWEKLLHFVESSKLTIKFNKVKGHSGNEYNELADKLAKEAITNLNAEALPSGG